MELTVAFIISILSSFQAIITWRPDLLSLLIGLILGLALATLAFGAYRLLNISQPESAPPQQPPDAPWRRSAAEEKFQTAIARLAQQRHLARDVAPLDQLFVPPRLIAPPSPVHPEKPPPLAATQLATLWPDLAARVAIPPLPTVSLRSMLLNGQRVILSSPPGTGKSTLLAYCAYRCAQAAPGDGYAFLYKHIPLLLHAGDLRLGPGDATDDNLEPLRRALQQQVGDLLPAPLLEQKADSGHLLLLLDGWSEVNGETRAYLSSWLRRLLARCGAISVIAATTSQGFEDLLDLDFTLSAIAPWRTAEAHALGQRWAAVLNSLDVPELQCYWQPQQTVLETTLRLWSHHAALQITGENLPALLDSAARRFVAHGASSELPPAALQSYCQRLAFATLQQADGELSPALAAEQAQEVVSSMAQQGRGAAPDAGALRATLYNTPFFAVAGASSLRWASLLWRNHFAAVYLARHHQAPRLRKLLRDPARAPILSHLAHVGSITHLAAWILETSAIGPDYDDLFRVVSWLSISRDDGPWRQQALIRLGQIISRPEAFDIQRMRAIAALADCNSPGILPLLHQLLHRSDPAIRQAAIAAIARFDARESVPLLQEMLEDGDADVRVAALHGLAWQQSEAAHQQLLLALIGRDELLRYAAVEALALGGPEEWRALRDAARDEDTRVRRAAAHGLAAIDHSWAEDLLRHMQESDEQWLVRSAATRALETRAQSRRQQRWYPLQASDLEWIVQWRARHNQPAPGGAAAVTLLCEMLSTAPEKTVRSAAARSLARVAIPAEERSAVWASLWQAARADSSGAVREAAHASLTFLQRARGQ